MPRWLLPRASFDVHSAWQADNPHQLPPRKRHKTGVWCWAVNFGMNFTGLSKGSSRSLSLNLSSNIKPVNRSHAGDPSSTRMTNLAWFLLIRNKREAKSKDQPTFNTKEFEWLQRDFCLVETTKLAEEDETYITSLQDSGQCKHPSTRVPICWSHPNHPTSAKQEQTGLEGRGKLLVE